MRKIKTDKDLVAVRKIIENTLSDSTGPFRKLFRKSSAGKGKYLRARLFFEFSGRSGKKAFCTAAAIEMLHMATLVHDDILDHSSLRRGMPPLYVSQGVKTGILYGDLLFSRSHELLETYALPGVMRCMNSALSEVIRGEIIQHLARGNVHMKKEEYLAIAAKKTGSLFGAACAIGAIFRGYSGAHTDKAYRSGEILGTAYQILNDCDDIVFGEKEKKGGCDIVNGIIALPLIILIERCSPEEKSFIKETIAKDVCRRGDAARINHMMIEKDAVSDAMVQVRRLTAQAKTLFREILPGTSAGSRVLSEVEEKVKNAEKEHSDSRRRVCGA